MSVIQTAHASRGAACIVAFVVALAPVLLGPTAGADDKAPLGGGAGIVVDGSYCTLTTIGHDKTGELVGFTAAHCGGPGAQVVAESTKDHGPLGTVATVDDGLDYSVIRFDPAKVIPIANFAGFAINGIGVNPNWQQPVCKLGAATGEDCRYIKYIPRPGKTTTTIGWLWQPGDDGGPVTVDHLLVGMISDGYVIPPDLLGSPPIPETHLILFSAILDHANANGGPGAGFSPILS